MSLVCVNTAVCRTSCSSTPVQSKMELILYLLIGTINPHCVPKPLQFYGWLVCCSTMLLMSVGTQSHVHYFKNALNDLKFLLFLVVHSRTTRSSVLQPHNCVKFLSGSTHQNFILQNSWPTVVRSAQKWLGASRWPQRLFMISPTADSWFFLLAGSWKKWKH